MPRRIRALATVLAASAVVAVAGCGGGSSRAPRGPGTGRPPLVIGSQDFTEQRILGQLYAQALTAKGYRVRIAGELPGRASAARALVDGRIDGYPEYIVAILETVAQRATGLSAGAAYGKVGGLEARAGFVALAPTPYSRTDALATTAAYARRNALAGIGGLARVGRLTLGALPAFATRPSGLHALRRAYGLTALDFRALEAGAQYAALDRGRVQAAVVATTDAVLHTGRYRVLADPKRVFAVGNVVPVFSRQALAAAGPALRQILNAVSARLTTRAMREMNAAVELDKNSPAAVAKRFLAANGLL